MRVLMVDLDPSWRGGQEQALFLLRGLRERGHEAELVALREGPLARHAAPRGIPVHAVPQKSRRLAAARIVRRLLHTRDFAIVHVNEPHALFSAWLARAHRHSKMVIARRVAFPVPRNFVSLIRYRAAARLIAVSEIVRKELLEARLDPPGVDVVPDGVELPALISGDERRQARERWKISADERVLSFVASLTNEKGHSILLEGFAKLRELATGQELGNCRLLLAGDGPLRQELTQKARELGIAGSVIFAGFVEDVRAVHAATDLFVFPALNEGAGSALLSAMACGLPVLAFARGGVNEIVGDGRTGLLLDDTSADSIARAAARLLNDGTLAQRLATAGRETITARFSSDHMVQNTLKVFEHLIDRPSPSVELSAAKKIYDRG